VAVYVGVLSAACQRALQATTVAPLQTSSIEAASTKIYYYDYLPLPKGQRTRFERQLEGCGSFRYPVTPHLASGDEGVGRFVTQRDAPFSLWGRGEGGGCGSFRYPA